VKKTLNAFFETKWVLNLEKDDNAAVVDVFVVVVAVVAVDGGFNAIKLQICSIVNLCKLCFCSFSSY
jgi:hypothetical protein